MYDSCCTFMCVVMLLDEAHGFENSPYFLRTVAEWKRLEKAGIRTHLTSDCVSTQTLKPPINSIFTHKLNYGFFRFT